jgi:cytochrome b
VLVQTPLPGERLIWDLPTRVFHWALAGSFLGAYLLAEEDGSRSLHVMFGYTVAGLIVFRLLWGFVGSTHARFRDFAYGPGAAAGYLRDLVRGRARDYDGHNPAGSWAIYALLALAAATALTGWLHIMELAATFEEIHECSRTRGWSWSQCTSPACRSKPGPPTEPRGLDDHRSPTRSRERGRDGRRGQRADAGRVRAPGPRWALGSALAVAVLGFWSWAVTTGGGSLLAGAESAAGHGEHAGLGEGARLDEKEDDD